MTENEKRFNKLLEQLKKKGSTKNEWTYEKNLAST